MLRRELNAALVAAIVCWSRRAHAGDESDTRIDALAAALRAGEIDGAQWAAEIGALAAAIDIDELLRRIDFERVAAQLRWPVHGAAVHRLRSDGAIVKLFGLQRGHALVPHGHDGIASMHLVVHGRMRGRHYDRIAEDGRHLLVRPTADVMHRRGDASTATQGRDNVHWFVAESRLAFAFGVAVEDLDPTRASRRVYVDPARASIEAGDVLRMPVIDRAAAMRRYGNRSR